MKNQIRIPLLATVALATTTAGAEAIYKYGESAHLHVLADVALVYEDNVFLQPDNLKDEDLHLEFTPGLELRLSGSAASSTILSYKHTFTRYDDNSELDDDFADARFLTRYDSGVSLMTGKASYKESYSNSYGIDQSQEIFGVLIRRNHTNFGASIKHELSELTAMSLSADYDRTNYELPFYADQESLSVPFTYFYKVRPNVDLTAGMRYRTTDTSMDLEYDDYYFFVGAVGELFSPVIYADLTIGYQERQTNSVLSADSDTATYNLSFIYTGNPKSTMYFTVARDYRTSAYNALAYAYTSAILGGNYELSSTVGMTASLGWANSEYEESAREEDIIIANLGVNYRPNDYLTVSANYYYRDVDGNVANYTDNEVRVTASLRY